MPVIEKSVLAKPTDAGLSYIFPKTSADCVYTDDTCEETIKDKLDSYDEKINKLREEMGGMTYESLAIKSFTCKPSYLEYGNIIKSIEFDFEFNRLPSSIEIKIDKDIHTVENAKTNIIISDLNINSAVQCTLTAYDSKGAYNTKTVNIGLNRKYYYGTAKEFTLLFGLREIIKSSRSMDITVNAGAEEYIYFACPINDINDRATFSVSGFIGGFTLVGLTHVDTICDGSGFQVNNTGKLLPVISSNLLNSNNIDGNKFTTKQTYALYKSDNVGLGNTTVKIS